MVHATFFPSLCSFVSLTGFVTPRSPFPLDPPLFFLNREGNTTLPKSLIVMRSGDPPVKGPTKEYVGYSLECSGLRQTP